MGLFVCLSLNICLLVFVCNNSMVNTQIFVNFDVGWAVTYIGHYISTLYITYIRHYVGALFNLSFMFIHCHER